MSCEIIQGDALVELPKLGTGTFDLLLCDPPYNVGKDYGGGVDDRREPEEYAAWLAALARVTFQAASDPATLYWFCPSYQVLGEPYLPAILRGAGWRVREKEFPQWYRRNGPGAKYRGTGQVWAPMCEHILMADKAGGLPPADRAPYYHTVLMVNTPQTNHPGGRWHVCEKPVRLYDLLVRAHRRPQRVLDPTCGSGSALVACAALGIDAVGIEIVPESAQLSRDRVQACVDGIGYKSARRGVKSLFHHNEHNEHDVRQS